MNYASLNRNKLQTAIRLKVYAPGPTACSDSFLVRVVDHLVGGACLRGDAGKMESLVKCAGCGKKPGVKTNGHRNSWKRGGTGRCNRLSGYTSRPPNGKINRGNYDILSGLGRTPFSKKHKLETPCHNRVPWYAWDYFMHYGHGWNSCTHDVIDFGHWTWSV